MSPPRMMTQNTKRARAKMEAIELAVVVLGRSLLPLLLLLRSHQRCKRLLSSVIMRGWGYSRP